MSLECPIHKVARNDIISNNECQSCDFYSNCPLDMISDMGDEVAGVIGKHIGEIGEAIREYTVEKLKEPKNERKNKS